MVVCCFVVFPKCANHFFIYWVGPLFNCSGLQFSLRSYGPRRCWLPVFSDIVFVFRWRPTFTFVFPFYSKNCFGVDPQEKAKKVKTGSKLRDLFQIADVDTGMIRWVNAYLMTHVIPGLG
ncbi:DUF3104 domain-containing protein [Synechococcus sp. BIOS-U3-1]|uniref:DUF3104 domain-containing protein n=1 Tax=Synechococcus sp. BIOS-U3-1 TaxID=1400865 RepID=UPI00351BF59C